MADQPTPPTALALHGGAGARKGRDYSEQLAVLRDAAEFGRDRLRAGETALDVAVAVVVRLEDSGLFIAGRGATPNEDGRHELDASLMAGATRKAGSVALLEGFRNPILVARRVMEATPHVMLAGEGASAFAREQGMEAVIDPAAWFTSADANFPDGNVLPPSLPMGTVGCVALDAAGRLAAATSTSGIFNKQPGRIGDAPLIGAGTWADGEVAVACTGLGEFYIRAAAAHQVAARVSYGGQDLEAAARATLDDIAALGGSGGLIAIDKSGRITAPHNSSGLKRALVHPDGRIEAEIY